MTSRLFCFALSCFPLFWHQCTHPLFSVALMCNKHVTTPEADPQPSVLAVGAHTPRACRPLLCPLCLSPLWPGQHSGAFPSSIQSHWWAQTASESGARRRRWGVGVTAQTVCQEGECPEGSKAAEKWKILSQGSVTGPAWGADQTAATTSREPLREGKASLGLGGGAGLGEDSTAGEAAPSQALPAGYAKCYKLGCRVDLALLSGEEDTNF